MRVIKCRICNIIFKCNDNCDLTNRNIERLKANKLIICRCIDHTTMYSMTLNETNKEFKRKKCKIIKCTNKELVAYSL